MATDAGSRRIGRRKLLAGAAGGALVAGALAIAGCDDDEEQVAADWGGELVSKRVSPEVPDRPDAKQWNKATPVQVPLQSQSSVLPLRLTPSVPSIEVRSLNDGDRIAFRLEWADSMQDDSVVKTDSFRDACAVLLGPPGVPPTYYMMGLPDQAASILLWRADWQRDIDAGFQDLESAFPNVAVDFYPPLVGAPRPLAINDDYPQEGRPWLVGWNAGNPLSQPTKPSPVERLIANGAGTLTHLTTQDATGAGAWKDGRWQVVIRRDLAAPNEGEIALESGSEYSLVFAIWSGGERDRGSRKSPSSMGKLRIEGA